MPNTLSEKEIRSLISLIDDDEVFDMVRDKIVELGDTAIPFIDEALETSFDVGVSNRLKAVYDRIIQSSCINQLREWKKNNQANLFKAMVILSRYRYAHVNLEKINTQINHLKNALWLEINDNLTALEKVRVLNHLFFSVNGYKGNYKNYYAPKNTFINDVLNNKKGNPIALSSLYSIVAQSVGMPVYGINLPRHFIVAYTDRLYHYPYEEINRNNILFYINPFNQGEIYSLKEVFGFLIKMQYEIKDEYILPCNNVLIVKRMINNLIAFYKEAGDNESKEKYERLLQVLDDTSD